MIHLREPTYSGRSHALVQIFGFLYAFIAGFLLTAVPRFTGTQSPSLATQLVLAGLLLVASVSSELRAFATATIAFVAAHVMLLTLIVQRFAKRTQNPPPSFANIGLGLLAGAAGALITSGVALELIPASWDLLGRRLLTEGMVMLLVLGVGGFLGPRLLGFAPPQSHQMPSASSASSAVESLVAGPVILISLVAEYGSYFGHLSVGSAAMDGGARVLGRLCASSTMTGHETPLRGRRCGVTVRRVHRPR